MKLFYKIKGLQIIYIYIYIYEYDIKEFGPNIYYFGVGQS